MKNFPDAEFKGLENLQNSKFITFKSYLFNDSESIIVPTPDTEIHDCHDIDRNASLHTSIHALIGHASYALCSDEEVRCGNSLWMRDVITLVHNFAKI